MTRQELLNGLEDAVLLPLGTLQGTEKLEDLEHWDSLAVVNFIALADTHSGVQLSIKQLRECVSVADLLKIANVGA